MERYLKHYLNLARIQGDVHTKDWDNQKLPLLPREQEELMQSDTTFTNNNENNKLKAEKENNSTAQPLRRVGDVLKEKGPNFTSANKKGKKNAKGQDTSAVPGFTVKGSEKSRMLMN